MPRTSTASFRNATVYALSPGFGVGWTSLNLNADRPVALVQLPPEQIIRGRLIDLEGRPSACRCTWRP